MLHQQQKPLENLLPTTVDAQLSPSLESEQYVNSIKEAEAELRSLFAAINDLIFAYDFTARKQAEAALQESQSLLEAVLNSSLDGVMAFSTVRNEAGDIIDFQWLLVNPAAEKIIGKTSEQLLGKYLLEEMPGNREIGILEQYVQVVETGVPQELEFYYQHEQIQAWFLSAIVKLGDGITVTFRDITSRKQAEAELRRKTFELQAIFNAFPDLYFRINPDGIILDYQAAGISNLYLPPELFMGRKIQEVLPADLETKVNDAIGEVLQTKSLVSLEYSLFLEIGKQSYEARLLPLLEDQVIVIVRDITERKQAEEERNALISSLQESEERFRVLVTSAPVGIFQTNTSGFCLFVNQRWLEITGLTMVEAIGQSWTRTVHPDDAAWVDEQWYQTTPKGEEFALEYRHQTSAGKDVWVFASAVAIYDTNGVLSGYLGTLTDISDRKQAEIERHQARIALEQQIQQVLLLKQITQEIRSSLDSQHIFQTAANQIGRCFGVNRCLIYSYEAQPLPQIPIVAEYLEPGYVSLLGMEEPMPDNPFALQILTQERVVAVDNVYQSPFMEPIQSLCETMGLKSILAVRTSYHETQNGGIGLHHCQCFRTWTTDEIELLEAVADQVGIAIAQAKLLEQERYQREELTVKNAALEQATRAAEAANQAKSRFLSHMSHELRTPLNAILGFTQVMFRDYTLPSEHRQHLGIISRSGEHLLSLINDILSMSKIEAGKMTLNENSFDLYRLLDTLEEMLQLKVSSQGLKLYFTRTLEVPQYVKTDESKLRQVLINLLGNAIKFTQHGCIQLRVGCHKSETFDTYLVFEVEDTGPGIAPEEIHTLFNPFVQTETGLKFQEGTGLGLPISRQFVQLMGGNITVKSILSQGTIFTFNIKIDTLPVLLPEQTLSPSQRVIHLALHQDNYRILVVEDVKESRQLVVELLTSVGFEVHSATNGQEAVEIWEHWQPHLILMDMRMPIMDGYAATQQIKTKENQKLPRNHSTIIIALTADAFEEDRAMILSAGCDDFVRKPFVEEVLFETMAKHLGIRYIYEELSPDASPPLGSQECQATLPPNSETLTLQLAAMPAGWMAQLYQAALCADTEWVLSLFEEIPESSVALAATLADLVNNFQFDIIMDLTKHTRH